MKNKQAPPIVLFNASVVLAGLKSPTGGSAKLLTLSKTKKLTGVISEIILDEIVRNAPKLGLQRHQVIGWILIIFSHIHPSPKKQLVEKCQKSVIDPSDAHILASSHEAKADFLVTLDKKHLLVLRKKVKKIKIVSPGELIEIMAKEKN